MFNFFERRNGGQAVDSLVAELNEFNEGFYEIKDLYMGLTVSYCSPVFELFPGTFSLSRYDREYAKTIIRDADSYSVDFDIFVVMGHMGHLTYEDECDKKLEIVIHIHNIQNLNARKIHEKMLDLTSAISILF